MLRKKKSGHQYRVERLRKEEIQKQNAISLQTWLQKGHVVPENENINDSNSEAEPEDELNENVFENISKVDNNDHDNIVITTIIDKERDHEADNIATITENETNNSSTSMIVEENVSNEIKKNRLIFNDPTTWNLHIEKSRTLIVEHGPEHRVLNKYPVTNGRCFNNAWKFRNEGFQKKERKWLFYSENRDAVFCFPCLLFVSGPNVAFCNSNGFNDWKHMNPQIPMHENTLQHINNFTKWKLLEKGIQRGGLIDDFAREELKNEILKWRHVLKIVLKCILFCAENNLALRGHHENIHEKHSGIFLNLIKFVSQFDVNLKNAIDTHVKHRTNYLSPQVQNEFINLLARKVRSEIIKEIQQAKYYSIIFDSTPDVSHNDQLTQIIRYIKFSDEKYTIEERFIGFINTAEKTGSGIASAIKEKLIQDGLLIENIRGQGYDNGTNMSGRYKGVQAIFQNENPLASYIPCCSHSLNLIGVHAASINADIVTFFGTIQSLYNFFASSTSRWEKISAVTKISLKKHSDTRWCSKLNAVSAVHKQIEHIILLLKDMKEDHSLGDALSCAKSLYQQLNSYKFIAFLQFWNIVLQRLSTVNISLQKKDQDIYRSSILVKGLVDYFEDLRNETEINKIFIEIEKTCEKLKISPAEQKRKAKRKKMPGEQAEDESPNIDFVRISCLTAIDSINMQLKERFKCLKNGADCFDFLTGKALHSLTSEELEAKAVSLSKKYPEINGNQITIEIKCLKHQINQILTEENPSKLYHLDILNILGRWELQESYPNITTALKIFLTMPTTVATAERSFSKLKLVKNYLRSASGQERTSSLCFLSIERELVQNINFDEVIDDFAKEKARKIRLL